MQSLLAQVQAWPTPSAELAVRSAFLLVTAYNRPDHPLLSANIVAMLALIDDESLDANSRVAAATSLLSHISKVADLALSDRLIRKIHQLLQAPDISELNRGMALTFCTWCRFTLAPEYESVLPALQQIETLAKESGLPSVEGFVYKYLAYLHLMSGRNLAAGEAALQHLASVGLEGTSIRLVNYHASCVYLCEWRGDVQGAKRHAEQCLQAAGATSVAFYIFHGAKLAHVFSSAGEYDRALALVDEIRRLHCGHRIRVLRSAAAPRRVLHCASSRRSPALSRTVARRVEARAGRAGSGAHAALDRGAASHYVCGSARGRH